MGRLLRVLSQKMLQRLNGKSVYFRNLSSLLKANKLEGRSMEPHMHSGIMATHWQQWNCMTLECRSEYHQYKPIAAQEDVRQSVRVLEEKPNVRTVFFCKEVGGQPRHIDANHAVDIRTALSNRERQTQRLVPWGNFLSFARHQLEKRSASER